MRYHVRPVQCPHDACNERFAQKKDMQRHVRSHHKTWAAKNPKTANVTVDEWKCERCEYATNRQDNLKRHVDEEKCLKKRKK